MMWLLIFKYDIAHVMAYLSLKAIFRIGRMMGIKGAATSAMLMIVACSSFAQSSAIGVVKVNGKGEWDLYTTRLITPNDKITVQYPDKAGRTDCCITVTLDGGKRKQKEPIVTDEFKDQEVWSYKLKPQLSIKVTKPFIGIAIVGNVPDVHGVGDLVHVENGGKTLVVTSCLGTEGVNVLARDSNNLSERLYLNLGYSVSPTCTDGMLE